MPTYEYTCLNCDYTLSEIRSIHDPEPSHICEKCAWPMKRSYDAPGVSFKGGGFYSTSGRG
jgi:putative FmdB family regulatory protein